MKGLRELIPSKEITMPVPSAPRKEWVSGVCSGNGRLNVQYRMAVKSIHRLDKMKETLLTLPLAK